MKRIISLVLTMVLIVACLAVPVMADESDSVWINVLDYGTSTNYGSNSFTWTPSTSNVLVLPSYYVPLYSDIKYVDVLFMTDDPSPVLDFGSYSIDCVSLGNGLWRGFGIDGRQAHDQIILKFVVSEGSYLEILQFKVSPYSFSDTPISYYGHVYDYSYTPIKETYFSGDGFFPMASVSISPNAGRENFEGFVSRTYLSSWNAYDFISLDIALWSSSFASLKVEMDGLPVPYEVNTVESTDVLGSTLYLLDILIDTRNLDRSLDSYILVDVSGMVNPTFTGSFTVRSCLGFVSVESPSLWTHWFTSLQGWLSTGFASIASSLSSLGSSISGYISDQTTSITNSFTSLQSHITSRFNDLRGWINSGYLTMTLYIETWGQNISSTITSGVDRIVSALSPNGSANDFNDKVQQQGSELENMAGAMGAVTRPDVSTAIPDIGGYLTVSGPVTLAAVFDPFWKNSYILRLLLGSLAVSVAFTVVYGGKK